VQACDSRMAIMAALTVTRAASFIESRRPRLPHFNICYEIISTFDITPVTSAEVIAVLEDYLTEHADSGVLAAQIVSDMSFSNRTVRVTFDPAIKGFDVGLFESVNPFSNLAEFVGEPIAFNDGVGRRLRSAIDSIETILADGTSLGKLTTAELYRMGTGNELQS